MIIQSSLRILLQKGGPRFFCAEKGSQGCGELPRDSLLQPKIAASSV
jgi:hypothetical protein